MRTYSVTVTVMSRWIRASSSDYSCLLVFLGVLGLKLSMSGYCTYAVYGYGYCPSRNNPSLYVLYVTPGLR